MPREIEVTSILNKTKKRDSWFLDDYTVNLYSSCSFNCLYCYIRGSKYGSNLEKTLSVKVNAIEILDRQLSNRAKKNQYGIIVMSSATDPYQKAEQKYQLTREALRVIAKHKFPVHILTKSDLVERDFDLLHQIDENAILPDDLKLSRGVLLSYSFSTLDEKVAGIFESGATKPSLRLESLKKSVRQGFLSGVSLMPLLPFISDTTEQLDNLYTAFKDCKARYVLPATITLFGSGPADSKTLTLDAIATHYPELLKKYKGYFQNGSEMPRFYQEAFYKKMRELSLTYSLPNRILDA